MLETRSPTAALRPFVKSLWVSTAGAGAVGGRERVLPTGDAHVVFLFGDEPLRVWEPAGPSESCRLGFAVVGGARAMAYQKEVRRPATSVGAQLRPGAVQALFGVPAHELAFRHTDLRELWGALADETRERLAGETTAQARLDRLERVLLARSRRLHGLHPAVAQALLALSSGGRVREAVAGSGYSHRRFIDLFVGAVGLTPKLYVRVRRFRTLLRRAAERPQARWADLAQDAGYADQAHLTREFRELASMSPGEWRQAAPAAPHHVPLGPSLG